MEFLHHNLGSVHLSRAYIGSYRLGDASIVGTHHINLHYLSSRPTKWVQYLIHFPTREANTSVVRFNAEFRSLNVFTSKTAPILRQVS